MKAAIFLDRDGVICVNRPGYVKSWEEFEFLPTTLEAMRRLKAMGLPVVVISNQSAVGRGLMSIETLDEINQNMVAEINLAGGHVDKVYVCTHAPDEGCACRKPKPGMLLRAAEELDLDLSTSYLIGDAQSDILAAAAVGAQALLVLTGRGVKQLARMDGMERDFMLVGDILDAAVWIDEQRKGIKRNE